MNELQIDAVLGCIAEIEHIAKNTSGAASIVMADLAAHMRQVIAPFDPESKLTEDQPMRYGNNSPDGR